VATLPLTDNGEPSTFVDIYRKLHGVKILKVPDWVMGEATFETDAGEVTVSYESGQPYVSGQLHLVTVLRDLIDLLKDGIDPHRAMYFYYEHDWSNDADELYAFFVVHDGKIVRERLSFMPDYPRVLTKHDDGEPIWHSEPYKQEAWETYWYRKFYTETLAGQLMVLRPDEPILYRYDRSMHDVTRDVEFVTVIKIYRLLCIAVALIAAMTFQDFKPYMTILAAVLFVELLWMGWKTRRIGR